MDGMAVYGCPRCYKYVKTKDLVKTTDPVTAETVWVCRSCKDFYDELANKRDLDDDDLIK